ncbi:hypothetical protein D3C87_1925190 [compost metagenome]
MHRLLIHEHERVLLFLGHENAPQIHGYECDYVFHDRENVPLLHGHEHLSLNSYC